MKFIKYKLINGKVPDYIVDGGYYPDGEYLHGFALDNVETPDGVVVELESIKASNSKTVVMLEFWPESVVLRSVSPENLTVHANDSIEFIAKDCGDEIILDINGSLVNIIDTVEFVFGTPGQYNISYNGSIIARVEVWTLYDEIAT